MTAVRVALRLIETVFMVVGAATIGAALSGNTIGSLVGIIIAIFLITMGVRR